MQQDDDYADLVRQIRRLIRSLDVQSRRIDRQVGLTLPQLIVLGALGRIGQVTSRALAAEADLSPPTVVGILDKLEAKGLVQRYRSERDRRIVHARVTPAGKMALSRAPDPLGKRLGEGFRALPALKRQQVVGALALVGQLAGEDEEAECLPEDGPARTT